MDTLKYKGFIGSIEAELDDNTLYGKVLGLDKGTLITYEGKTIEELKEDFINAVDDYIASCKENGLPFHKSYTGSFRVDNGRCSTEIHSLDAGDHTWSAEFTPDGSSEKSTESRSFTIDQGYAWVYIDDPEQSSIEMGVGESRYFRGHVDGPESSEVNISSSNDNVAKFRASSSYPYGFEGYIDAVGAGTATITVSFAGNKNYKAAESKTLTVTVLAPAATGPEVAWNKATKTGSFTMPGGNVTLAPEYYPQATVADGGVTAADADARATTDDPLVKVDATKLTGAKKLMYFVSNSGTTAPAYDAEGWTDQLPTAEGLTQQGIVYVWYYPVGIDEGVDGATATYSDGDICLQSITARIAAEPTYAVTFAEGTDPKEWTASPNTGVKKDQTVTVTYTGSKKVIGVKAEKKAAAPAETTVTLTTGEIGDLSSWGSNSKTINGITIAVSGDACFHSTGLIDVHGDAGPNPDPDQVYAVGTFTFTSSAGKIKRIDINHNNGGLWYGAGEGWPGSYQVYDNSTFTWSGTPAASVTLNGSHKGFEFCVLYDVSSIVFTLEPTN